MVLILSKGSVTCTRWRSRNVRPSSTQVKDYLFDSVLAARDVVGNAIRTANARIQIMADATLDASARLVGLLNQTFVSAAQRNAAAQQLIVDFYSNLTQQAIEAGAALVRPTVQSSDELLAAIQRLASLNRNVTAVYDQLLNQSQLWKNASEFVLKCIEQEQTLLGPWRDLFAELEADATRLRNYNWFVRNVPPAFAWDKLGPLILLLSGDSCPAVNKTIVARGPCTCAMLRNDTLAYSSWDHMTPFLHPLCILPSHPTWLGFMPMVLSLPFGALFAQLFWAMIIKQRKEWLAPEYVPLTWRCSKKKPKHKEEESETEDDQEEEEEAEARELIKREGSSRRGSISKTTASERSVSRTSSRSERREEEEEEDEDTGAEDKLLPRSE
jgi:hypothetical protein